MSSGAAPSAARLAAVLAAPPGRTVALCLRTTGTGASGDSREASPHQYLSRMTSPITRILWPEKRRSTAETSGTWLNVTCRCGARLSRAGEQARAVQRVADGHHHPAHGVLGDVEAVAEIVSRPKVIEDVAAGGVEDGVGFGDGSPGRGDALFQHARHPVPSPPHRGIAVHFWVGIERRADA